MPRPVKNHKNINVSLSTPVYERFRAYAEDKGQTYTLAMERIIKDHLDREGFKWNDKITKDAQACL